MAQPDVDIAGLFDSESSWPFLLRKNELHDCINFFTQENENTPKVLRIFGTSGTGKSFFARELIVRLVEAQNYGTALYLNIPASGLEASNLFTTINRLISTPKKADRSSACFVSKELVKKWMKAKKAPTSLVRYVYHVFRGLTGQIPVAGPFIQAFLPTAVAQKNDLHDTAFRFLLNVADEHFVLIVFDNIQFMPTSVLEILETEIYTARKKIQIVVIERISGNSKLDWLPPVFDAEIKEITFNPIACCDVEAIINVIFPSCDDQKELAKTIFRRSDGNLKSVWFQLKFIYMRRTQQVDQYLPESYEEVIQSLHQIDKVVLCFVTILLGGLTVSHILKIFEISNLHIEKDAITGSISDLIAIGLLVINGDNNDKVRVEHEIVSQMVESLTPEEEKLELRQQIVTALCNTLSSGQVDLNDEVLYDRLIGLVTEHEFRSKPTLQALCVDFISDQNKKEKFIYLTEILRNTVCWDVLDVLPSSIVRSFLNAIQKCSLFNFGLIAAEKLKKYPNHISLARLYEAKYLVQLFRYDEAELVLEKVRPSAEKDLVIFNILLNLCKNSEAKAVADAVYTREKSPCVAEYELTILRNSGHLFEATQAIDILKTALKGFEGISSEFGIATTYNNLGIVYLVSGSSDIAKKYFIRSQSMLDYLGSNEVYQPLVNISGALVLEKNYTQALIYLDRAKEIVPRLLSMDAVMIEFNTAILAFLGNDINTQELHSIVSACYVKAQKTKDLRFSNVVGWFLKELSTFLGGETDIGISSAIIDYVFEDKSTNLELFINTSLPSHNFLVPYFLSPHWRY